MAPVSFSEPPFPAHSQSLSADRTKVLTASQASSSVVSSTTSNLPVVTLDVDVLTDSVAARLATSLLGHVLFLKNQIPLPIVQLARLPNGRTNNKATKLKTELLSAFDTLTSHLVTTFSALSTALARSASAEAGSSNRVYLAILVGSSLGTAKSKVFYGVDHFEARIWGNIDQFGGEEEIEAGDTSGEELPEESEDDGSDEESDSFTESEEVESGELENTSVKTGEGTEEASAEGADEEDEDDPPQENTINVLPPPRPSPYQSYAEEQRFLQGADRLLARTLASADANGRGISNEMSPTQTHVLLRAPRRFIHPAWIPRQNLAKQMESALTDFLEETWPPIDGSHTPSKSKKQVEGVWVTGKEGLGSATFPSENLSVHEDDEMIWWSWDGKLVGFSDW